MSHAYSVDLRKRVVFAVLGGMRVDQAAATFDLGTATVKRWVKRYKETNSLEALPRGGNRPRVLSDDQEQIVDALVKSHPDWTEEEYTKFLVENHGFKLSRSTVGRVIRRLGYSVKNRPSLRRSEIVHMSASDVSTTSKPSEESPLRVWYLWTKRVQTSR
jgi:transposase